VGNFPPLWTEWNGRFRDTTRDFWHGAPSTLAEFASRLLGSADLYQDDGRKPVASVNFVTCHDGFTLADLVSYNEKHNEANTEDNRDGENHNRSWNCGVEGPTDNAEILALRARQRRNFIATLLLSQGVPMIGHGDELGRTQRGNNNAYCHDSELTWVDWDNVDERMLDFTRKLTAFRSAHRVFKRRRFLTGRPVRHEAGTPLPDVQWFTFDAREMEWEDWNTDFGRSVALFVNGEGIKERGPRGERHVDESFMLCFNASEIMLEFVLPPAEYGEKWQVEIDTAEPANVESAVVAAGGKIPVPARSLVVLIRKI
jgi:glycogen operon protein